MLWKRFILNRRKYLSFIWKRNGWKLSHWHIRFCYKVRLNGVDLLSYHWLPISYVYMCRWLYNVSIKCTYVYYEMCNMFFLFDVWNFHYRFLQAAVMWCSYFQEEVEDLRKKKWDICPQHYFFVTYNK
jgi:hypothetical protein